MNIRKLVGGLCIAAPCISLVAVIVKDADFMVILVTVAETALCLGMIALGVYLLDDSTRSKKKNSETNVANS